MIILWRGGAVLLMYLSQVHDRLFPIMRLYIRIRINLDCGWGYRLVSKRKQLPNMAETSESKSDLVNK